MKKVNIECSVNIIWASQTGSWYSLLTLNIHFFSIFTYIHDSAHNNVLVGISTWLINPKENNCCLLEITLHKKIRFQDVKYISSRDDGILKKKFYTAIPCRANIFVLFFKTILASPRHRSLNIKTTITRMTKYLTTYVVLFLMY